MKKLIFLLLAVASVSFASAQKISGKDVPPAVKSSFHKQYPHVKNIVWEKEKGHYEAGFKQKGMEHAVLMNASGNILETEEAIAISSLPLKLKEYVIKNYPGKKIKEAAKIINAQGILTYEAEVNGRDLIFDHAGDFLKETGD